MSHTAENDAWVALEAVRDVLASVDINSLSGSEFERMWAMQKVVSAAFRARVIPPAKG
jgi:hypothetical protein